jgi:hypothetical protein
MRSAIPFSFFVAATTACLSNRPPFTTPMADYRACLVNCEYPKALHNVRMPDMFIVTLQPGHKFQDHVDSTGVDIRNHLTSVNNYGTEEKIEISYHAKASLESILEEVRMDRGVQKVYWVKALSDEESEKRGGLGKLRREIDVTFSSNQDWEQ